MRYPSILLTAILLTSPVTWAGKEAGPAPTVTVYRSPSCGCCGRWIAHLRQNGFQVIEVTDADMADVKRRHGIPVQLRSCHTAEVGGYTIEGHVPAADIRRLLRESPPTAGLSVPGMPAGSPGMEMGPRRDDYTVWRFTEDGSIEAFAVHDR